MYICWCKNSEKERRFLEWGNMKKTSWMEINNYVRSCRTHLILIPSVMFGRSSGSWFIFLTVCSATSALWIPYCSLQMRERSPTSPGNKLPTFKTSISEVLQSRLRILHPTWYLRTSWPNLPVLLSRSWWSRLAAIKTRISLANRLSVTNTVFPRFIEEWRTW